MKVIRAPGMLFPFKLRVNLSGEIAIVDNLDTNITSIELIKINALDDVFPGLSLNEPYRGLRTLGTYYTGYVVRSLRITCNITDNLNVLARDVPYWIALTPLGRGTDTVGDTTLGGFAIKEYPGTGYKTVTSGHASRPQSLSRKFWMKDLRVMYDPRDPEYHGIVSSVGSTDPVTGGYAQLSYGLQDFSSAVNNYAIHIKLTANVVFFEKRVLTLA